MRFLELFAGAGGLSMGLEAAGLACVGHAEIEPDARAVLRHQWPGVPLYGDVTTLNGADLMARHPFDLLTGGSPCQDLSVAGKRAGLAGARSGLFHHQHRIWMESGAPYLLWENVFGALSSNDGADFAVILSTLVGAAIAVPRDGWARGGVAAGPTAVAAWRVLDLQHFGPPQRRVRVFVLAARAGGCDPAEILALAEGVCGHPAPRRSAGEGAADGVAGGAGSGGALTFADRGRADDAVLAFNWQSGGDGRQNPTRERTDALHVGQTPAVVQTLTVGGRDRGAGDSVDNTPVVAQAVFGWQNDRDGLTELDTAPSLRSSMGTSGFHEMNHPVVAFKPSHFTRGKDGAPSDTVPPLSADADKGDQEAVVMASLPASLGGSATGHNKDELIVVSSTQAEASVSRDTAPTLNTMHEAPYLVAPTLNTTHFGKHQCSNQHVAELAAMLPALGRPRRLLPVECERLMGWPDGWTEMGTDEDGAAYALSDTARYRLCGNGVGSPCTAWIGRRLLWAEAHA